MPNVNRLLFCAFLPLLLISSGRSDKALESQSACCLFKMFKPSEFNWTSVKERALSDAKDLRSGDKGRVSQMIHIAYFTDSDDYARAPSAKGASEVSYESWHFLYEKYGRNPPPAADLTVVRNAAHEDVAVVRYRSGDDLNSEIHRVSMTFDGTVVQDPLQTSKDGMQIEVLELIPAKDGTVRAYVKAAPAKASRLHDLGQPIANKLSWLLDANVEVFLRSDSWFITDPVFPIVFRFETPSQPPTKAEYDAAPMQFFSAKVPTH